MGVLLPCSHWGVQHKDNAILSIAYAREWQSIQCSGDGAVFNLGNLSGIKAVVISSIGKQLRKSEVVVLGLCAAICIARLYILLSSYNAIWSNDQVAVDPSMSS